MEKSIIENMLISHLKEFKDVIIDKTLKSMKLSDGILKQNLYTLKRVKINDKSYNSEEIIKLILAHKFIKNNKSSYFVGTGKDIFDIYMSDGVEGQIYIQNVDTLIVYLGNDFKNSYLQEILPSLLVTRKNQNIIIWNNKTINDASSRKKYIDEKYGEALYTYITTECKLIKSNENIIGVK